MHKRILFVLLALVVASGCAERREPASNQTLTPEKTAAAPAAPSKDMVRQEVEQVLRENPDLLLEVLAERKVELFELVNQGVQEKRAQAKKERLAEELANPKDPKINPERPRLGPKDAPITIVEYSDFLCPYCGRAAKTVEKLQKQHPQEVALYFKHMPLHENSMPPALYFEAISLQDEELAWKFHDLAFEHSKEIAEGGEEYVKKLVEQLDGELDMARLQEDVNSEKVLERIARDAAEADTFQVQGTPYFLVDGVSVPGAQPLPEFEQILELVKTKKAQ